MAVRGSNFDFEHFNNPKICDSFMGTQAEVAQLVEQRFRKP